MKSEKSSLQVRSLFNLQSVPTELAIDSITAFISKKSVLNGRQSDLSFNFRYCKPQAMHISKKTFEPNEYSLRNCVLDIPQDEAFYYRQQLLSFHEKNRAQHIGQLVGGSLGVYVHVLCVLFVHNPRTCFIIGVIIFPTFFTISTNIFVHPD